MVYLWTEDTKSGYFFWKFICSKIFSNTICVKSFNGSSELVKAVIGLTDTQDKYLIAYDFAFDNPDVMDEYADLRMKEFQFDNIFLLNLVSSE